MAQGHIPYGYRIENGTAVIDEAQSEQIKKLYSGYLSGMSYTKAAQYAGFDTSHASVKRILKNKHYIGDDFYPAIIDRVTFDSVEIERVRRAEKLGRIYNNPRETASIPIPVHFLLDNPEKKYKDPYKQAEYVYSHIESEE